MPTATARTSVRPILASALAFAALHASAGDAPPQPAPVLYDGRYYEVVITHKITWEAAKAAAEARMHGGVQGRLATIGSLAEDVFVHQLRAQVVHNGAELWVGGYQVACATDNPEPACGWLWLNGEAIGATNSDTPYTNWQNGEPNNLIRTPDSKTLPSEDHLAIGLDGQFGWNDEGNLRNIAGYIVEYGDKVTIPAEDCTAAGPGCNPTGAQILQFPPAAKVADGATLTAQTYRFRDDPARCGVDTLVLFDGDVVIPAYLCGHPDFLVIKTETTGVDVPRGAILVENLTDEVLPDNLYGCTAVRQNPAGQFDPDPSHRDVVAWQSDDPSQMLESTLGTGRYFGTLAEVTYDCGSSRGKVRQGSYHFVGLRIHPGAGAGYADDPRANHQSFVELTRYKLQLLQASVAASKHSLPKFQYLSLRALVDAALYSHDRRRYKAALVFIRTFLYAAERANYAAATPDAAFSADHIMRSSNLEYMYTAKLIPFAP